MAFYSFNMVAFATVQLWRWAYAKNLDVPLRSDHRSEIKPVFTIEEYDGWSVWMEEEMSYKVFVQSATWEEAEAICKQNNAHLASIMSDDENNLIYDLVKANVGHSSPPDLYDEFVWLGGKQKNYPSSREWSWADGRTMSYTHWNGGEPNNKDGNERCMQLFNTLENRDYTIYMVPRTWNDVDCNRKMRAFVCKR